MLNINQIKNSKIIKEPWEHLEITNFLQDDVFNIILEESKNLSEVLENTTRNTNGFWPFELLQMGMKKSIVDIIMEINKEVLRNHNIFTSKFTNPKISNIGYYSIPRLGYTPRYGVGELHDDGHGQDNKTIVIVVYLHPSVNEGTYLYNDGTFDSLSKRVDWQPNKALVFAPKQGVTWHNFKTADSGRYILNFYCEKIEDSHYIHTFGDNKISWFYDNFDDITLSLT